MAQTIFIEYTYMYYTYYTDFPNRMILINWLIIQYVWGGNVNELTMQKQIMKKTAGRNVNYGELSLRVASLETCL